ncbi:tetratricopeptide repeat protein [Methanolobus profundi]|uniref:Outer membrane protein assembly factor BamD, BamD/ComL family n=1 Tax=Methanolobus profundi TaxID=487685 RepID=A0A1I4UMU3_9EURY|nr:tetratricopeptide repeat protein [Methanolobus profundi]SFM90060.1 Outer membrane protein assembly factor BamD, BamD/ComL family [Methanolobus profundi]
MDNLIELSIDHFAKIDKMISYLEISEGFSLSFLICNEPILCDAVISEVEDKLSLNISLYGIHLDSQHLDLLDMIKKAQQSKEYQDNIQKKIKTVFFVTGFDEAVECKTDEGLSKVLLTINIMREKFLEIQNTILIRLNVGSFSQLLNEAPDFYSWRTSIFEFKLHTDEDYTELINIEDIKTGHFSIFDNHTLSQLFESYNGLIEADTTLESESPHKIAYWYQNLGMIESLRGYDEKAIEYFTKALSIYNSLDEQNEKINIIPFLMLAYHRRNQYDKELDISEELMSIFNQNDDMDGKAALLRLLANVYSATGDSEKRDQSLKESLELMLKVNSENSDNIDRIRDIGSVYSELKNYNEALKYYNKSLSLVQKKGDYFSEKDILSDIGSLYRVKGDLSKALDYYKKAVYNHSDLSFRENAIVFDRIGDIYKELGYMDKAIDSFKKALSLHISYGDGIGQISSMISLGHTYFSIGKYDESLSYYAGALELSKDIDSPQFVDFCSRQVSKIKRHMENSN